MLRHGAAGVLALAMTWCWLSPLANAEDASLASLRDVRDAVAQRLARRIEADAQVEPPVDLHVVMKQAIGSRGLDLELRRRGGRWVAVRFDGVPDELTASAIDASELRWAGGRLTGPLRVTWRLALTPWAGRRVTSLEKLFSPRGFAPAQWQATQARASREALHTDYPVTYHFDTQAERTDATLLLTLERGLGDRTITLAYTRAGPGWRYDRPVRLAGKKGDRLVVRASKLTPAGVEGELRGTFEVFRVPRGMEEQAFFEYWQAHGVDGLAALQQRLADDDWSEGFSNAKHERHMLEYNLNRPRYTVSGRFNDRFFDGRYQRTGGTGERADRAGGSIIDRGLSGGFEATAKDQRWRGTVAARVEPVSEQADALPAVDQGLAVEAMASALYRQACAYHLALVHYPMRVDLAAELVSVPTATAGGADLAAALAGYAKAMRGTVIEADTVGQHASDDPDFGPYHAPIAAPATLAAHEAAAPQRWVQPGHWRFLGPLPVSDRADAPRVPEVAPAEGAAFAPGGGWLDARTDDGWLAPPGHPSVTLGDQPHFAWYAATTIQSAEARTAWLAVQAFDRGAVWVNGELAWRSGDDDDPNRPALFRAKLRAGANTLLVRVANDFEHGANAVDDHVSYFENFASSARPHPRGPLDFTRVKLSVNTAGAPRPAERVAAAAEARVSPGAPRDWSGYRGDGRSTYPEARPPMVWDDEKGTNVAWRRALPLGFADPVLRGGKLFVAAEQAAVHCFDAQTGEPLWHHVVAPPAEDDQGVRTTHAAPAPAVTEDRVFAHFGTGQVICFDHTGNVQWRHDTGATFSDPVIAAPVIAGGTLVIQLPGDRGRRDPFARHDYTLRGLDPATGAVRWDASVPVGMGAGMAVSKLRNAAGDTADVILTTHGQAVDPTTGDVLHRKLTDITAATAAPFVDGQTAYWASTLGLEAIALRLDEAGRVLARPLWRVRRTSGFGQNCANGRYGKGQWFRGPLVADGLVYTIRYDTAHVPGHYLSPWLQLDVYDAHTGQLMAQIRPVLRASLNPVVPPVLAGDHLLVVDGGRPVGGYSGEDKHGKLALVDTRFPPTVVSTNRIDHIRATPVARGDRLYLRTLNELVCYRITDDRGRREQHHTLLRNLFERIGTQPDLEQLIVARPLADDAVPDRLPLSTMGRGGTPARWLTIGPAPRGVDATDAVLRAVADSPPAPGDTLAAGDAKLPVDTLPAKFLQAGKIDVGGVARGKAGTTTWYPRRRRGPAAGRLHPRPPRPRAQALGRRPTRRAATGRPHARRPAHRPAAGHAARSPAAVRQDRRRRLVHRHRRPRRPARRLARPRPRPPGPAPRHRPRRARHLLRQARGAVPRVG